MKLSGYIKMFASCIGISFLAIVAASILDIFISAISQRFYDKAVFVVIFGVAGVFAAVISYMGAIEKAPQKTKSVSLILIAINILVGLIIFFLIARIEGGEYEAPFKAFGIMLVLSSLPFINYTKTIKK